MSSKKSLNFIEQFIEEDLASGKYKEIHTRFPPEPNGYLHMGHAKAIVVNFELGKKYGGKTNLRMDDTNPVAEDTHYVENIINDIKWLGYEWDGEVRYASDYFEELYAYAQELIKKGLAYIDDSSPEVMNEMKGTPSVAATPSPYRDRSVEENLDLFDRMRKGEFEDGARVLRAKISLDSPNMWLRDPILYRIRHVEHHRTGNDWCIYPMYDFAHGQSDSLEGISHSLCSLEFKHHRPLYNWFIKKLEIFPSRQIEFARMNVSYMITSKRKLLKLVEGNLVTGWDDPRMPTIAGMRRRGYPPMAIRNFCERAGVARRDNVIEYELLDFSVREVLNKTTPRYMAVLDPVKVVLTNWPADKVDMMPAVNNPEDESMGSREIPFTRELYIERDDFMIDPPAKYNRMAPGRDIRLIKGYIIHCDGYTTDEEGNVTEIQCSYYEDSRSGSDNSGVRPKGTIHWVSATESKDVEVRLYDRLFTDPSPDSHEGKDFTEFLNPDSLKVITAKGEPILATLPALERVQFMRKGYYCVDRDTSTDKPVFNLTATLRDKFSKKKK